MFDGGGTKELVNREIPEIPGKYPEFRMFGMLPAYGFYCRHAENLTFKDVEIGYVKADARPAMVCDDIVDLELSGVRTMIGAEPVLQFIDVQNAIIQSCRAPGGTGIFLEVRGVKSKHISLTGNDLSEAKRAVSNSDNIDIYMESNRLK